VLKSQRPLGLGCIAKLIAQALVLALSNQLNFPTLTCILVNLNRVLGSICVLVVQICWRVCLVKLCYVDNMLCGWLNSVLRLATD